MLFIYLYIWSIKAKAKLADIKKRIMKKKKLIYIHFAKAFANTMHLENDNPEMHNS